MPTPFKTIEVVRQKMQSIGKNPDDYAVEIRDGGSFWQLLLLPVAEVDGGDFEFEVTKADFSISDTKRFQ